MSEHEFPSGRMFCVPYAVQRPGETPEQVAARNGRILDVLCDHPHWYAAPLEREQIRQSAAWMLTHPEHLKWEIWQGGKHVGMFHLSRLLPGVDALLHFASSGISLLAMTALFRNFLSVVCFGQLGLQRVSFEVPDGVKGLIPFFRQRLGFTFEGERNCAKHPLVLHLKDRKSGRFHQDEAEIWVAKQGSRREAAHWDGKQFRDVFLLRLLRSEFQLAHPDTLATPEPSVESRIEASRIQSADPPGPAGAPE